VTNSTIGNLETFAVDLDKVSCDCCSGPPWIGLVCKWSIGFLVFRISLKYYNILSHFVLYQQWTVLYSATAGIDCPSDRSLFHLKLVWKQIVQNIPSP
jgi:hypothetical protein